ncbi:MAG: hypothetical protein E6Q97_28470 [Desulfurellales bacterium]|nr:MAG: hypothetical protein E6Q97_28470 [Desulfurellales bacterium]
MATASKQQTTTTTTEPTQLDKSIEVTVYGTKEVISLSMEEVRKLVANPTKTGKLPSNRDVAIFMKVCKARGLNPYQRDVFLLGYDTKDGPKFETVVALGALLKRAEGSPGYEGKEYGVLVSNKAGAVQELPGDYVPVGHQLVGGWCRVYRTGRRPEFCTSNLKSYDKGFGHWNVDKPWMIAKCAIAKALRQAFPSDVGDLTIQEELGASEAAATTVRTLSDRLASLVQETEARVATRQEEPEAENPDADTDETTVDLGELWQELESQLADAETLGDLSRIDQHVLPLFPAEARANAKALVDAKHAKMEGKR